MHRALKKLINESIHAIPAIIYFCLVFNLIHFAGELARRPGDLRYFSFWEVTIAALIVGKMLVIINCFSFINAYPHKPMIYNILWKLFIYMLGINLLCMLHIVLHQYFHLHSLAAALLHLKRDFYLPIFWSTEMGFVLTFLGYIIFSEFVRVLGRKEVQKMIFG